MALTLSLAFLRVRQREDSQADSCFAKNIKYISGVLFFVHAQLRIPEKEVGNYVGALIGAFSFANFLSSAFIGHLSDMYGRKMFLVSSCFLI